MRQRRALFGHADRILRQCPHQQKYHLYIRRPCRIRRRPQRGAYLLRPGEGRGRRCDALYLPFRLRYEGERRAVRRRRCADQPRERPRSRARLLLCRHEGTRGGRRGGDAQRRIRTAGRFSGLQYGDGQRLFLRADQYLEPRRGLSLCRPGLVCQERHALRRHAQRVRADRKPGGLERQHRFLPGEKPRHPAPEYPARRCGTQGAGFRRLRRILEGAGRCAADARSRRGELRSLAGRFALHAFGYDPPADDRRAGRGAPCRSCGGSRFRRDGFAA